MGGGGGASLALRCSSTRFTYSASYCSNSLLRDLVSGEVVCGFGGSTDFSGGGGDLALVVAAARSYPPKVLSAGWYAKRARVAKY